MPSSKNDTPCRRLISSTIARVVAVIVTVATTVAVPVAVTLSRQHSTDACIVVAPSHGNLNRCPESLANGESCQIACGPGFDISGNATSCVEGTLVAQSCIPTPCALTLPSNAAWGTCSEMLESGKTCQLGCVTGATRSGASTSCTLGTADYQECTPNICSVTPPLHGRLGTCSNQLLHGDTCQLFCEIGYQAAGPQATQCWFGALIKQTCEPLPCSEVVPGVHATSFGSCPTNGSLASGQRCSFDCEPGYSPKPALSSCQLGTAIIQTCEPTACQIPTPQFGIGNTCNLFSPLASGSECSIACKLGYELVGEKTRCDFGVLTSQSCRAKACGAFPLPTNGSLGNCPNPATVNVTASNTTCAIRCDGGYAPNGARSQCVAGQWITQTCQPAACIVTAPSHGVLGTCTERLASGASCAASCDSGYLVQGQNFTCLLGNLTSVQQCFALSCSDIAAPAHGTTGNCPSSLSNSTSCQFQCDSGYHADRNNSACTNGVFVPQTCIADDCINLSPPAHASMGNCAVNQTSGTTCQIDCLSGYTRGGGDFSYCEAGVWSSHNCTRTPCANIVPPTHGTLGNCSTNPSEGSSCQMNCDNGFIREGESSYCQEGVWFSQTCRVNCSAVRTSCKEHRDAGCEDDGVYLISSETSAYCDMTHDGGGWTSFYAAVNGQPHSDQGIVASSYQPGYFSAPQSLACSDPATSCIRLPPETLRPVDELAVSACAGKMVKWNPVVGVLDFVLNGVKRQWIEVTQYTSIGDAPLNRTIDHFYSGDPGNGFDHGWIMGSWFGDRFAVAMLVSVNPDEPPTCDGVADITSTIRLYYRTVACNGDGGCGERTCIGIQLPAHADWGTCSPIAFHGAPCSFSCHTGFSLSAPSSSCTNGTWASQACV